MGTPTKASKTCSFEPSSPGAAPGATIATATNAPVEVRNSIVRDNAGDLNEIVV